MEDINKWMLRALNGDCEAQYHLANCYFVGEGIEEDYKQAFELYKVAAEQGHLDAANNLADMYLNGEGIAIDEAAALHWFTVAASGGVMEAWFTLGLMYEQGLGTVVNDAEALVAYLTSARGGDMEAQYRMGNIYYYGLLGQSIDFNEAMNWYKLVAENHHVDALFDLGYMYVNGIGVEQDVVKGISYYKKAALQGDGQAQTNIGLLYLEGEYGIEKNIAEAVKWLKGAQRTGNEEAVNYLNKLVELGIITE